ncbi:MAG: flotillin domain-containing protein, partial [Pseudomonadota bacterium]
AQMVKPAEKIDSIKIHQVSGLTPGAPGTSAGHSGGSPVTQAVDAIASMAVQLPALKKLGEEVGISMQDGMAGLLAASEPADPAPKTLTVKDD